MPSMTVSNRCKMSNALNRNIIYRLYLEIFISNECLQALKKSEIHNSSWCITQKVTNIGGRSNLLEEIPGHDGDFIQSWIELVWGT